MEIDDGFRRVLVRPRVPWRAEQALEGRFITEDGVDLAMADGVIMRRTVLYGRPCATALGFRNQSRLCQFATQLAKAGCQSLYEMPRRRTNSG